MKNNGALNYSGFLRALFVSVTLFAAALPVLLGPSRAGADGFNACVDELAQDSELHMNKKALTKFFAHFVTYGKKISNKKYGLLIDYNQNSKEQRSYLIRIDNCTVVAKEYVIHGGHGSPDGKGKVKFKGGDANSDGKLDKCVVDGSRTNMTRPGPFITDGCHETQKKNWSVLWNDGAKKCQGIRLVGQVSGVNDPGVAAGVVLHEHTAIKNNDSIKPVGQGCPAYPKGKLKGMVKHGITEGTLVYVYAPQCGSY